MSNKGIFTALSGAIAQDKRMETIANNMANVNTPAFKRDQQIFQEYLTAYEKAPEVIQVPKIPASVESFYDLGAGDRGYVDQAGTYTSYKQGALRPTGNALDVAIEGKGFFEVLTPGGVRMTRNGSFTLNSQGQITTKEGFPVLRPSTEGEGAEARVIQMQPGATTISSSGGVFQDGEEVGQLSVVNVNNEEALKKVGSSLYSLKENYQAQVAPAVNINLHQGFLENSNINIIKEMTDMISATRVFESTQKAIQAYDQMNDKLVNTVPRTR